MADWATSIATPWDRFKCWLLHGRHHSIGTDETEEAIYGVRWCRKCGVTIPRDVVYKAADPETEDANG